MIYVCPSVTIGGSTGCGYVNVPGIDKVQGGSLSIASKYGTVELVVNDEERGKWYTFWSPDGGYWKIQIRYNCMKKDDEEHRYLGFIVRSSLSRKIFNRRNRPKKDDKYPHYYGIDGLDLKFLNI